MISPNNLRNESFIPIHVIFSVVALLYFFALFVDLGCYAYLTLHSVRAKRAIHCKAERRYRCNVCRGVEHNLFGPTATVIGPVTCFQTQAQAVHSWTILPTCDTKGYFPKYAVSLYPYEYIHLSRFWKQIRLLWEETNVYHAHVCVPIQHIWIKAKNTSPPPPHL